jgi:hypothetical protein
MKYSQEIPIAWHHIREARTLVHEALAQHDRALRDAAGMTLSELLENALKYGEAVPGMPGASYTLQVEEGFIEVQVSNGLTSEESLAELKRRIDAIGAAADKQALYIERLEEIMNNPAVGGQLGLFRIGCEGGFDLSYRFEPPLLTVTARRALP